MASDRQIAANRLNSKKSTGPKTDQGKRSSRRNAIRHGLIAETTIDVIEDPADYEAFEEAIKRGYNPRTGVEYELLARIASLLWRLRRATAIESGLLRTHAHDARDRNIQPHSLAVLDPEKLRVFYDLMPPVDVSKPPRMAAANKQGYDYRPHASKLNGRPSERSRLAIIRSFQRLASLDNGVFDRLGRYETSLWRQTAKTIVVLDMLKGRAKNTRGYRTCRFRRVGAQRQPFFPRHFYK